jgi:hypothetical protein
VRFEAHVHLNFAGAVEAGFDLRSDRGKRCEAEGIAVTYMGRQEFVLSSSDAATLSERAKQLLNQLPVGARLQGGPGRTDGPLPSFRIEGDYGRFVDYSYVDGADAPAKPGILDKLVGYQSAGKRSFSLSFLQNGSEEVVLRLHPYGNTQKVVFSIVGGPASEHVLEFGNPLATDEGVARSERARPRPRPSGRPQPSSGSE